MSKLISVVVLLAVINYSFSTICKDASFCEGRQSCCRDERGEMGCCRYENANCCQNGSMCCPTNYICDTVNFNCIPPQNLNQFAMFLEEFQPMAMLETTPAQKTELAFPSPTDIFKCISDIKPVITDITQLVEAVTNGDKEQITNILLNLAKDGYQLGVDCAKILQELLKH